MTEHPIRPDVRVFLDLLKTNPRPELNDENIAAFRPMAAQGMAMIDADIGPLARTRDVAAPGPAGRIATRLFDSRASRARGPAVIFFHGGGFVIGDLDTHAAMCAEISRQLDLPVIAVDYRLAPDHRWPAAPDDAEAATRWIAANAGAYGLDVDGIVLAGDSAGANLTLVTALALRDRPAAAPLLLNIAIYPPTDPAGDYPSGADFANGFGLDQSMINWYRESLRADRMHWRHAPLHAKLSGLAPTLISTASLDPLRDQGRAFAAKAVAAGVDVAYVEARGAIHGFACYRRIIPSAQGDLDDVLARARVMLPKR